MIQEWNHPSLSYVFHYHHHKIFTWSFTLPVSIPPHFPSYSSQHSSPVSIFHQTPPSPPQILTAAPPHFQPGPNRQVDRDRIERAQEGAPSPDGRFHAECLKITTWQWASHGRFQSKSNVSFQNGPLCVCRDKPLSLCCFFSSSQESSWLRTHIHLEGSEGNLMGTRHVKQRTISY